jgi:hypothetical protein
MQLKLILLWFLIFTAQFPAFAQEPKPSDEDRDITIAIKDSKGYLDCIVYIHFMDDDRIIPVSLDPNGTHLFSISISARFKLAEWHIVPPKTNKDLNEQICNFSQQNCGCTRCSINRKDSQNWDIVLLTSDEKRKLNPVSSANNFLDALNKINNKGRN